MGLKTVLKQHFTSNLFPARVQTLYHLTTLQTPVFRCSQIIEKFYLSNKRQTSN